MTAVGIGFAFINIITNATITDVSVVAGTSVAATGYYGKPIVATARCTLPMSVLQTL